MKLKSLSVLGLLAAAPMASQAAMVEMNETEMSDVSGQADFSGLLFNYSASFDLNPSYVKPDYSVTTAPVTGGVQRDSSFDVNWEVQPDWSFEIKAKDSAGTTNWSTSGSSKWNPIEISYDRSRFIRKP